MIATHRILVAECDRQMARQIAETLGRDGFDVRTVPDAEALRATLKDDAPELLVLDADLPDQKGLAVLRDLRAEPAHAKLPILMTSARKDEIDRVVALELGVDDYQEKPFSLRELSLRIRAILRRGRQCTRNGDHASAAREKLSLGVLELDIARHHVKVEGRDVSLTPLELRLLVFLVERADRVVTRESLLTDLWGLDSGAETRTVDTTIKRLRKKLGAHGEIIETVRGVGYRVRAMP